MMEHVGSFVAKDEAGNLHTVDIYQDFIDNRPHLPLPGMKAMKCNGRHVNPVEKGRYEMLGPGRSIIKLSSDDPAAP
jgi:hypothetical protein